MRQRVICLTLVALGAVAAACDPREDEAWRQRQQQLLDEEKTAVQICKQAGGFVVRSARDGRITDCKIPGAKP